jgi:hypothetical protein
MGAQGSAAFWPGTETLRRRGGDEEVVRPQQAFDEHGVVLGSSGQDLG